MLNVLVTNPFGERELDLLRAVSPQIRVVRQDAATADYSEVDVVYGQVPPDLSRAPKLRWLQLHGAGVENMYSHPVYTQTLLPLTNTSGVHAAGVAQYVIAVTLALVHRLPLMVEWQQRGSWPPDDQRWSLFQPSPLRGRTMGIVGYGSIGRELARLAKTAFAMSVLVCKRDPAERRDAGYYLPGTGDPEGLLPDAWFAAADVTEVMQRSDIVVVAAPLTAATRQMIGREQLSAMKPDAYFVNVGRGSIVDETALIESLSQRRIGGAALDVFEQEPCPPGSPLYALDNVILSPHVSGFIPDYDYQCCELFAQNLRRFLESEPLLNLIDRDRGY